jgi:hypothetical protein
MPAALHIPAGVAVEQTSAPDCSVSALQLLPLDTSSSWQSLTSTWLAGLTSTPDGMESILGIPEAGGSW